MPDLDQTEASRSVLIEVANVLGAFRDEIVLGDIAVTPDPRCREVLIGRVTGRYEYRDPSPAGAYPHVRTVEWLGRFARDALPDQVLRELRYQRTIRRLTSQGIWHDLVVDGL